MEVPGVKLGGRRGAGEDTHGRLAQVGCTGTQTEDDKAQSQLLKMSLVTAGAIRDSQDDWSRVRGSPGWYP